MNIASAIRLMSSSSSKKIILDSFNRVDNSDLGATDTGETWYIPSGLTYGLSIVSSKAQSNGAGISRANYIETGLTNSKLTVNVKWTGENFSINMRSDTTLNNRIVLTYDSALNRFYLIKRISGVNTTLKEYTRTLTGNPDVIEFTCNGNDYLVKLNGSTVISDTNDNILKTNTKVILATFRASGSAGVTFDNFKVEEL